MDSRFRQVNKIIDEEFKNTSLGGRLDDKTNDPTYFVDGNNETTWREYLIYSLRHTFGLMSNEDVKYLPLVAKLAFSDEAGFEKRDDNGADVAKLIKIVEMVKKDESLFQRLKNIADLTFAQVVEMTEPQVKKITDDDTRKADEVEETDDYNIIEVTDFETAKMYGDYTCSQSKLCYTQKENVWQQFKGDKNENRSYLCLKKNWEDISEEATEDNPYDLYGTSMIFVFIDPEGDIAYSNTRWNHQFKGYYDGSVDHAFSKTRLARTVGRKFSTTFKPYSKKELREKGYVQFDEVPELLEKGVNPLEIFDWIDHYNNKISAFIRVGLNNKVNILTSDNKLLFKQWYVHLYGSGLEGVLIIVTKTNQNFIDYDGKLLSSTWFKYTYEFHEGFAVVCLLNNKWNYVNKNMELLDENGFDYASTFHNGFACVEISGKHNVINTKNELQLDVWVDNVKTIYKGEAKVIVDGKFKIMKLKDCQ